MKLQENARRLTSLYSDTVELLGVDVHDSPAREETKPVKIGLSDGALVYRTIKFEIFGWKWTFKPPGLSTLLREHRLLALHARMPVLLDSVAGCCAYRFHCTFTPVSMLLLDMLEIKQLNRSTTGGVGKAIDLRTVLKQANPEDQSIQEACVLSVVDELAEHLAQSSFSVAFPELSFIPVTVRLRTFCKSTKVERFRKAMKELIRQVRANVSALPYPRSRLIVSLQMKGVCQFLFSQMILQLRISLRSAVCPSDEKKSGVSPLLKHVATLREVAQQKNALLSESSVLVGEHSSVFGSKGRESEEEDDTRDDEGIAAFSSSWLPGKDSKAEPPKDVKKKKRKRKTECQDQVAMDEDIVQELVLSSDEEDGSLADTSSADEDGVEKPAPSKQESKKPKRSTSK
ncbi:nucleolar complex-associated protein 2-like [Pyrus communis]|uniref:nucleolar complex-associated protein 2-like n=1 Tax=Pyrus communis TaxID=23211 RepID=UPI0035BF5E30